MYPNPANSRITFASSKKLQGEAIIRIFNVNGQQVMKGICKLQDQAELDVSTLAKDIYMVKIQTKSGIESKKLVIQ